MSYDDSIDDELATAAEPEPEPVPAVLDEPTTEYKGQEPHKGNPTRSRPDLAPVAPDPDLEAIRARSRSLYRQSTPTIHHGHFGNPPITAEPALLDVPTSRYMVIQNRGPAELYLSNAEAAPAFHTLSAPTADEPGDTYLIEGRVFLRSAGDSSVHIAEYYNHQEAAA